MKFATSGRSEPASYIIAATGLRIGELLALRWCNLDLTIGTLSGRESVFEGKTQQPKTQRARRTIPFGPHAIALLKEHRDRATRKSDDDLVFPNKSGEPLRESKLLERVLQPAAERAGLGRVTWRQFRHIHSPLLNDLRVPVKILGGHPKPAINRQLKTGHSR